MHLTCPICGTSGDLTFWVVDEAERHAIGIALGIPRELRVQVLGYLKLFEPAQRRLSVSRAVKVLAELDKGISAAQIHYKGKLWAAPLNYWGEAMDAMMLKRDSLTLPLPNHNYLYSIISGMSSKAEAAAEARAEDFKRHRTSSDHAVAGAKNAPRKMPNVRELFKEAISKKPQEKPDETH